MTKIEKKAGILERIANRIPEGFNKDIEKFFSELAIISYSKILEKYGVLKKNEQGSALYASMPGSGSMDYIQSVVQEFDWRPTDLEITTFLKNVINVSDKNTRDSFLELLVCLRDEGEESFQIKYCNQTN